MNIKRSGMLMSTTQHGYHVSCEYCIKMYMALCGFNCLSLRQHLQARNRLSSMFLQNGYNRHTPAGCHKVLAIYTIPEAD
jgi:hypothetical protein